MSSDRRSWHLKAERAEQHLEEVKTYMGAYAGKHPYRAVDARQPKGKRDIWVYRLEMLEQPDPMIAVIIGEFFMIFAQPWITLPLQWHPRAGKAKLGFP